MTPLTKFSQGSVSGGTRAISGKYSVARIDGVHMAITRTEIRDKCGQFMAVV